MDQRLRDDLAMTALLPYTACWCVVGCAMRTMVPVLV
jgi:hypothetical protein